MTGEGRTVAVALMLAGIALLAVVTATIAAWFVERVQATDVAAPETSLHDVMTELHELRAQLDALIVQCRAGSSEVNP